MWICSLQTQGQKQRPNSRPTQPLSHSSRASSKIEPSGHERDMPSCERERTTACITCCHHAPVSAAFGYGKRSKGASRSYGEPVARPPRFMQATQPVLTTPRGTLSSCFKNSSAVNADSMDPRLALHKDGCCERPDQTLPRHPCDVALRNHSFAPFDLQL